MSQTLLFWGLGGLLGATGIALLYWSLLHDRARGKRRCPKCWYDMDYPGNPLEGGLRDDIKHCHECGHQVKSEKKLFQIRRKWRWATIGFAIVMAGGYLLVHPKVKRNGWASLMPTTVLLYFADGPNATWSLAELHQRITRLSMDPMTRREILWDWQWGYLGNQVGEGLLLDTATVSGPSRSHVWPARHRLELRCQLMEILPATLNGQTLDTLHRVYPKVVSDFRHQQLCTTMTNVALTMKDTAARRRHVETLVDYLGNNPSFREQGAVIEALALAWHEATSAVPALIAILASETDPLMLIRLITTLGVIGPAAVEAVDLMADLARDLPTSGYQYATVQFEIRKAIDRIDPQHPRRKEMLLDEFASDPQLMGAGHRAAMQWKRAGLEPGPLLAYLKSVLDTYPYSRSQILVILTDYSEGGPSAAWLVLDIIEQEKIYDAIGNEMHVLSTIGAYPVDVIARLKSLIEIRPQVTAWVKAQKNETQPWGEEP